MHLDNDNVLLYRTMSVVVDSIIVDDAPVASCHLLIRGRRLDGFVRRQTFDLASSPPNSHDDDVDDDIVNLSLEHSLDIHITHSIPKTSPLI
jgi:hypothetical protein